MSNYWNNKNVVLVGGAALIGSHLADALIDLNVKSLLVLDDLSSGKLNNLPVSIDFRKIDARNYDEIYYFLPQNTDIVFHLACAHGGRGYVDTHRVACFDNLSLDATVFRACRDRGVGKVIFSSSACAYPIHIQRNKDEVLRLNESLENYTQASFPDGAYGWAKLMGEMTLKAYSEDSDMRGISTRSFTVYGTRMKENHAIAALIAKTWLRQEPFEIWGDGNQIRNWTYVTDNVNGAILAAEKLDNGVINVGIEDRLTVNLAAQMIWDIMGWEPERVVYKTNAPTGPVNRVADSSKLKALGWEPKVSFEEGLTKTIEWYLKTHNRETVSKNLGILLTER